MHQLTAASLDQLLAAVFALEATLPPACLTRQPRLDCDWLFIHVKVIADIIKVIVKIFNVVVIHVIENVFVQLLYTSVEFVQPLLLFAPFPVVSFEEAVVSKIIGIEADGVPEFLVLPVAAAARLRLSLLVVGATLEATRTCRRVTKRRIDGANVIVVVSDVPARIAVILTSCVVICRGVATTAMFVVTFFISVFLTMFLTFLTIVTSWLRPVSLNNVADLATELVPA